MDTYLLYDCLAGVRNGWLLAAIEEQGLKRIMKRETRIVFILFLPPTQLLPLNGTGE